ncbi:MAG: riboflavin synthase subunit beta [Bacteroidia bacterium]|nr:riboflavin synthase subunit beta [Bacteroidia bacterium]NND26386.1 riboflavin synthase subunit beta [Flavobacteriaceae bacterium]MBT8278184.1 riboflavin synthase subunit beta [Bacteroidia bacterium]NNK58980.1 riboflavin synthase subunit beta [Flavobacteriaceae bacterium]NNL32105.1 riboflavin synthase subunit beta [Flavobacteriaceae bacterium]
MGIFKLRKNKRFGYTPRYYKGDTEGSPFEIKHKFDDYRSTAGSMGGIKTRFNNAMEDLRGNPNKAANRRILYIVIVLLLVFLFIIDFDLSIFFR